MAEEFPEIDRWRETGKKVALATVVNAYGSAPRQVGARMAINEDGAFVGSVSGGCVENDVVEHAKQVLDEGQPRLVPYGITDDMAFNVGLACGGRIQVFIQPFEPSRQPSGPHAWVYVVQGEGVGAALSVTENGDVVGSLGRGPELDRRAVDEALQRLRADTPGRVSYPDAPGGPLDVFVDTYPAPPTLYIFGGVHIAVTLARLAKVATDFRVVLVDARGVWATHDRFPDADEIHVQHAEDYLAEHPLASNSYVAVLSHDPKLDDPALFGALRSPARFVGAIGSKKTQEARRERLRKAGLSEEDLARLHGPIGLNIGAQNPQEIAVAILAQMLAAKNGALGAVTAELAAAAA
jgi:xanthine dehydrogenase accessory factor